MTRLVDSHAAAIDRGCFDEITGAGNGAAENVDAGTEVPDAAGANARKTFFVGPDRRGERRWMYGMSSAVGMSPIVWRVATLPFVPEEIV
jgi:hypothetical protein